MKADFAELDVGDKTYYVSHRPLSWWDADAACKALGRDGLVKVDDLITGWNGGYDYNSHKFTDLGKALQSHYGTDWFIWTNNSTDGINSCHAYYVGLLNGTVGNYARSDYYFFYAVCR